MLEVACCSGKANVAVARAVACCRGRANVAVARMPHTFRQNVRGMRTTATFPSHCNMLPSNNAVARVWGTIITNVHDT